MSREEMQERAQYQEVYFIDQANFLHNPLLLKCKDRRAFYESLPLNVRNDIAIEFADEFANKWDRVELTHNRRK